jgi:hypothetical protein
MVAVLEQVLGKLIKGLVGRLGLKNLRAIPPGVFEESHSTRSGWPSVQ